MTSVASSRTGLSKDDVRLIMSIVLLIVIFWMPPMGLNQKNLSPNLPANRASLGNNDFAQKFLIAEHKKAVDEIAARIAYEDDWFKWKFLVLGGVLTGAFTFVGLSPKMFGTRSSQTADQFLEKLLTSRYLSTLLALIVVLSVGIDIHERQNVIITNQLGLWIAYVVEPAVYGPLDPKPSPLDPKPTLGWEQFIRYDKGGLQTDIFSSITMWTLLHFLTFLLYAAYLLVLRHVASTEDGKSGWYLKPSFWFVHMSILAFAFAGHSIPGNFCFIVGESNLGGLCLTAITTSFTIVLIVLNYPDVAKAAGK